MTDDPWQHFGFDELGDLLGLWRARHLARLEAHQFAAAWAAKQVILDLTLEMNRRQMADVSLLNRQLRLGEQLPDASA